MAWTLLGAAEYALHRSHFGRCDRTQTGLVNLRMLMFGRGQPGTPDINSPGMNTEVCEVNTHAEFACRSYFLVLTLM